MDPQLLKALATNETLRVGELKTANAEVFSAISAQFGQERERVLASLVAVAPDDVKRAIAGIEPAVLASEKAADAVASALDAVRMDDQRREALLAAVKASPAFSPASDDPDIPLVVHPAIKSELERAELLTFVESVRLPPRVFEALSAKVANLDALDDEVLGQLVAANTLTDGEARSLGVRVSLYHATGGETDAAHALANARFNSLGSQPSSARELLRVPQKELAAALDAAQVRLAGGVRTEDMAATVIAKLSEAYPFEALQAHFGSQPPEHIGDNALHLASLLARDPAALARDFEQLDLKDVGQDERAGLQAAHAEVATLVRRYPGLGLEASLQGGSAAEIARSVSSRLALVESVIKQNPDVEFLALDYAPESTDMKALKVDGLGDSERNAVVKVFKAQQRVFAVADDPAMTARVLEAGYASSVDIARDEFEAFARKSGLPADKARIIHDRASGTLAGVGSIVGSVIDVIKGGFDRLGVGNLFEDVSDALKKMDGYTDLFGPIDGCDCEHCQSILSPAAYFVDLMYFIEEHVTTKVFTGLIANHALNLKVRRPDLWTLPLTCENTDTLLPTLVIVNEILESYIANRANPAIDLNDRKSVADLVYNNILPTEKTSFLMPFVLGAAKTDTYLEAFEQTRAAVVAASGRPGTPQETAAFLKLARQEYDVIVTPNTAPAYLKDLYRVDFVFDGGGVAAAVDVQDMLPFTNLTRAEFGDLATSVTVTANGARNVRINAQKRSVDSVQNDIERISGLTAEALDAMNRMARLWRAMPWTVAELDLALAQRAPGGAPPLDAAAVNDVATVVRLAIRFGCTAEEACALWSAVPRTELAKGHRSLFDRLFNNRPYAITEGMLPQDAVRFVHPAFRSDATPQPADNTLQRLFLGLKVSEADLGELIRLLAVPLGANLVAVNQDDRGFALSHANISLLYRHARLVKLLRRSVAELGQMLKFAGLPNGVGSLADLSTLLAFEDWTRSSSYSLDDLAFATGNTLAQLAKYPAASQIAAAVVDQIASEGALLFADTVFAFVPGVSEDDSRKIVGANAGLFEAQPQNMLRLNAATAVAPAIVVPAGVNTAVGDLQAVLALYHAGTVLRVRLAAKLGVAPEKFASLLSLLGLDLTTAAFAIAAQGGARANLEAAADALARLAVVFKSDDFATERLAFLGANLALFGIADVASLTVSNLCSINAYQRLTAPQPLVEEQDAPDPVAVETSLTQFTAAQKFNGVAAETLGKALGVAATAATTMASFAVLGNAAIPALATLAALTGLSRNSGIGADSLRLLVSEVAGDLDRSAESLVAALRQKYPDDKDFEPRLEPLDNRLHGRKRDALADHVIRHSEERFTSLNDLYDYFLIDVQMQGCARTSRVVAAISSAQTYVHRIRLNLEQDRRDLNDPQHVHVLPSVIPADEWTWRKNYRVWEANRKVFLWPENYVEPELRDDKTPLFKALEETLLQQDVNEQHVLDAYGAYLSGFEEAAGVCIAGAYHELDASKGTDVLHVFGATNADPPAYYYWTISNLYYGKFDPDRHVAYSARRKIDVSIPARTVCPIVYLGRLFVFWNEIATSSNNQVVNGESKFIGYKHKLTTKFVSLRLDGSWSPPQVLQLLDQYPFDSGGIISDGLTYRGGFESWNFGVPAHSSSNDKHTEYQEGYTLTGFQWENTYPATYGALLITVGGGLFAPAQADLFEQRQKDISPVLRKVLNVLWGGGRPMLHIGRAGSSRQLYVPWMTNILGGSTLFPPAARQALVADIDGLQDFFLGWNFWADWIDPFVDAMGLSPAKRGSPIANLHDSGASAFAVIGAPSGAGLIMQTGLDAMYVYKVPSLSHVTQRYEALRLGTTLARTMSRILFTGGVNELLAVETQKTLAEGAHLLEPLSSSLFTKGRTGTIDFNGALGVYYKEIFFHIPLLIAHHLNSRQNFAAAQSWFHYAFDPTATLDQGVNLDGLSAGERQKVLRDRVWRYIEFRNLTSPKLRDILTDEAAIKAYKEDPFNPHAIARLRISAYQKSVVMMYVRNLIDWGDSLFTQFTMESVNEALVLYVMASEIMGRPPADVGDCGEGSVTPKNYQTIRPTIDRGSEFLLEAESVYWVSPRAPKFSRVKDKARKFIDFARSDGEIRLKDAYKTARLLTEVRRPQPHPDVGAERLAVLAREDLVSRVGMAENTRLRKAAPVGQLRADFQEAPGVLASMAAPMVAEAAVSRSSVERFSADLRAQVAAGAAEQPTTISRQADWKKTRAVSWESAQAGAVRVVGNDSILIDDYRRVGRFGWSIVRQLGPVFCVPQNKDLKDLWARVQDRLYKIRHCLNIDGERIDLALFAPEIDPRLLVRAAAAGLSIEDVLGPGSGNLPPYRFLYLIEKARQYAASVQGFGAQLLATLEKRDGEELARLRNTQAMNMLKLTTRMREWDLKTAEDALSQVDRQIAAVEYRRDYYVGLIQTDLLPWERTQQVLRHGSTAFYTLGALFGGTAGVLSLIPQIGSPFAMKYGGQELGNSFKGWSKCFSDTAKLMDVFAASAGLEASFERRREGWDHQAELARKELKQLEKTRSIAQIRVDIATRALELHKKSIADQDEIITFFKEKVTGLGLYTWMSTNLQRIYRQAFNAAQAMAKLAERAYRFERGDEVTELLQATYWEAAESGLLAGERLIADLADMDKRFVETNYRTLEIDQSFSLLQLHPAEVLRLRQNGECEIAIPEYAFDLFYPGHYRRRIKAARMTIPCITGPYANVSATLTLKQSFVRKDPQVGAANLIEVPLRHTSTVATSTAQNDAGVFDFSFRDERYMPFEGAGAISVWSVTLPQNFRPFDYQTINDVILHLSYSATADGVLRGKIEDNNAALEGTIAKAMTDEPLARALSLRQDFSSIYQRLVNSAPGTEVLLELDDRILPIFIRLRTLNVSRALLLIRGGKGAIGAGTKIKINGQGISGFANTPEFPGWCSADMQGAIAAGLLGKHTMAIEQPGDLAPPGPAPNDPAACDPERLLDLALYVEIGL